MGNLFNMDNPIWTFIGKLADVILLNLLWLICCIPIVTIGPATTALYYVTLKLAANEEGYVFKGFMHSFKENLKQGMIIGIIMTIAGLVLVVNHYLYFVVLGLNVTLHQVTYVMLLMISLIYVLLSLYIYPILAKFDNPIKVTFKNAIFIAVRHLPSSVLMLIVSAALTLVSVLIFPPLMLFGMGLVAFLNSFILVNIFKKYLPEEEPKDEFKELTIFAEEKEKNETEVIK